MERGDNHSVTPYWHLQSNMQAMFDKALIESTLHSNWRRCSNKFFPSVLNATNCLGSFFHLLSIWMLILSKICILIVLIILALLTKVLQTGSPLLSALSNYCTLHSIPNIVKHPAHVCSHFAAPLRPHFSVSPCWQRPVAAGTASADTRLSAEVSLQIGISAQRLGGHRQ